MHETRAQSYWNHNTAYFPWVKAQIPQGSRVLDVGCGDGTLAAFLCGHAAQVDALDPFPRCIELAQETYGHLPTLHFAESPFETFAAEAETYDAVTSVASLHHMERKQATVNPINKTTADHLYLRSFCVLKWRELVKFTVRYL
ncbi:MAG: class I SAM-dependent methyltransferase [Clostridia bacterium]|nr:class I SAM-dependent methyltransferase [Clostridia bacterium]